MISVRLLINLFSLVAILSSRSIDQDSLENCSIVEETLETSSMRKFLETNSTYKTLSKLFQQDSSAYSILVITDDQALYSYSNNSADSWKVFLESIIYRTSDNGLESETKNFNYSIENRKAHSIFNRYSTKRTVYSVKCPKDYIMFDQAVFQAIWIKEHGRIRFLYYTTKCGVECLTKADAKKVLPLLELWDILKSKTKDK